jgi:integrase
MGVYSRDTRYLEFHKGKWRVAVNVPRPLQGQLGATKLKRSLHTGSLREAQAKRWPVVAELKALILKTPGEVLHPSVDIEAWRAAVKTPQNDDGTVDTALEQSLARMPEADREKVLEAVYAGPTLMTLHGQFLNALGIAKKSRKEHELAVRALREWIGSDDLSAVSRKAAIQFLDSLPTLRPVGYDVLRRTPAKLSQFWRWMVQREMVAADPWTDLTVPGIKRQPQEPERAFTDSEVVALLSRPDADPAMIDIMKVAALTGARAEAILGLTVTPDGDTFIFPPMKSEKSNRKVPVHSGLGEIVARRSRDPRGFWPEFPIPEHREPSTYLVQRFMRYRRACGVEEMVEGNRRSRVNFHSFRRYWITKAEQAGQPEHLIAAVVGHKRPGLTLGRYSSGPSMGQLRACVEAIKLS